MLKNEDSYRITSFASCRGRLCSVVAVAIKAFHSTSDQTRRCHLGVVGVFFFSPMVCSGCAAYKCGVRRDCQSRQTHSHTSTSTRTHTGSRPRSNASTPHRLCVPSSSQQRAANERKWAQVHYARYTAMCNTRIRRSSLDETDRTGLGFSSGGTESTPSGGDVSMWRHSVVGCCINFHYIDLLKKKIDQSE